MMPMRLKHHCDLYATQVDKNANNGDENDLIETSIDFMFRQTYVT